MAMKRALFKSVNLIGDALYISPALRAWHLKNPDYEIDLITLNDHVTKLYWGMGVPLRAVHYGIPPTPDYEFQHVFDVNQAFQLSDQKQQHIAESYADLLGVNILPTSVVSVAPGMAYMPWVGPYYVPINDPAVDGKYLNSILVSMFSASCSSRGTPPGPANKMLPWSKWKPILKSIRKHFPQTQINVLGAPEDSVPEPMWQVWQQELGKLDYSRGIPLDQLAIIMRTSKFVVTLDNGMAHLAASQRAKEFVFYPKVLGRHYILPLGNPSMRYLHMDPNTLNPVEAIWNLQQAWKDWGLI